MKRCDIMGGLDWYCGIYGIGGLTISASEFNDDAVLSIPF